MFFLLLLFIVYFFINKFATMPNPPNGPLTNQKSIFGVLAKYIPIEALRLIVLLYADYRHPVEIEAYRPYIITLWWYRPIANCADCGGYSGESTPAPALFPLYKRAAEKITSEFEKKQGNVIFNTRLNDGNQTVVLRKLFLGLYTQVQTQCCSQLDIKKALKETCLCRRSDLSHFDFQTIENSFGRILEMCEWPLDEFKSSLEKTMTECVEKKNAKAEKKNKARIKARTEAEKKNKARINARTNAKNNVKTLVRDKDEARDETKDEDEASKMPPGSCF
jgi:hypothetical protein